LQSCPITAAAMVELHGVLGLLVLLVWLTVVVLAFVVLTVMSKPQKPDQEVDQKAIQKLDHLIVWLGPTLHGKSTAIQHLVKGTVDVATGSGNGLSCTTEMTLYLDTLIGDVLDTVGCKGAEKRLTNMAIAQQLAAYLIKHSFQGVKFIIVNSLVDQAMSITQTLMQFNLVFPNALRSVLVLGTQVDKVTPESEVELRWCELEKRCEQLGVGMQMKWQSYKDPQKTPLDDFVFQAQLSELQTKLKALEPCTPQKASELQARIDQKMHEMHNDHGTMKETVTEDVEEEYVDEYESDDEVPVQTTKTTFETITKRVPIPMEVTRRKTFPMNTVKLEWVECQVPVTNSDTQFVKKRIKKQKVCKRTVPKTVQVEVTVPKENFWVAAKDAILEENEEQMRALIANGEAADSISLNQFR